MVRGRQIGGSDRQLQSFFEAAQKLFGKSEPDAQRSFRGYPEESIALVDGLPFTHVAARHQSSEGRHDAGLLYFQLEGMFFLRRGIELFLDAQNVPLRSEEHTSELQSLAYLVCRLLLEKKKKKIYNAYR